jgi:16S rRNA processing protein RimM
MGLISFGKITKPHGLAGEVKLLPHSRTMDSFNEITRIYIEDKSSDTPQEFNITSFRFHKNTAILKLNGVDSIEEAQSLGGREVYIQEGELGMLDEDEYYFFDLIGLEAYTEDGAYLGKVEEVMERAIQSILVIKNKESELLVPMAEPIVKEINLEEGKVIISPVKGMLDQD